MDARRNEETVTVRTGETSRNRHGNGDSDSAGGL